MGEMILATYVGQLCIFFMVYANLQYNIVKIYHPFYSQNVLQVTHFFKDAKHFIPEAHLLRDDRSHHQKCFSTAQPDVVLKFCCPLLEQM